MSVGNKWGENKHTRIILCLNLLCHSLLSPQCTCPLAAWNKIKRWWTRRILIHRLTFKAGTEPRTISSEPVIKLRSVIINEPVTILNLILTVSWSLENIVQCKSRQVMSLYKFAWSKSISQVHIFHFRLTSNSVPDQWSGRGSHL